MNYLDLIYEHVFQKTAENFAFSTGGSTQQLIKITSNIFVKRET